MQKIQTFSGSITLGSSAARQVAFGQSTTATVYTNQMNLLNSKIAEFLRSCDVDAYRGTKSGVSGNWLWIEGVPFLFYSPYNSNYTYCRAPNTTNNILSMSGNTFQTYNGTAYKFRLGFCGKAKNAWILRIGVYNATAFVAANCIYFYHAKDITQNKEVRLYAPYASSYTGGWVQTIRAAYLGDKEYVNSTSDIQTDPTVMTTWGGNTAQFRNHLGTKYPLIPCTAGPYVVPGVYQFIGGMNLPQGATATTDSQTEALLGSKRFLITTIDAGNTGYFNAGLIETT